MMSGASRVSPLIQTSLFQSLLTAVVVLFSIMPPINSTVSTVSTGSSAVDMANWDNAMRALSQHEEKLTRYRSHRAFLDSCTHHGVIPRGMRLNFGKDALPPAAHLRRQYY